MKIQQVNNAPYTIDSTAHHRFDERNTVFVRKLWDCEAIFYGKPEYRSNPEPIVAKGLDHFSRIDYARMMAAWDMPHLLGPFQSWQRLAEKDRAERALGRLQITDTSAMSDEVKRTAKMFGACLVGIAPVDLQWVYSLDRNGEPIEIPESFRFAIVLAVEMSAEAIATSPSYRAACATAMGYGDMAYVSILIAQFIRRLGYRALPMSNDTALSIPLAIDAGLGQLGRNGLLCTPEYGSRIRLCKVFTDLPLAADRPIDFGLTEFCQNCMRCADACEADAISHDPLPSYDVACRSNSPGILRWAVHADRCYAFWQKNGASCSNCIAACPMSQGSLRQSVS